MRMKSIVRASILAFVVFPILVLVFVDLPASAVYNRRFRCHVSMAYDQATFEGMKQQILLLWEEMNNTFQGFDYAQTYNTPWYWEQTYENSLAAQQDYFRQLVVRLDSYSELYKKMLGNSTNPVYLEDWYHKSIQNFREEMQRAEGLDWVLRDAWYLNFAPLAYWSLYWVALAEIAFLAIATIAWWKSEV